MLQSALGRGGQSTRCRSIFAFPFLAVLLTLAACSSGTKPQQRDPNDAVLFGPAKMRLHPIFTQLKDWTGDAKPDGVETFVELQDQFGDPTKASGKLIFALYEFKKFDPERRGVMLAEWIGDLSTLEAQRDRWNRTSRTYGFQLAFGQVQVDRNYLLTAEFQLGNGGRLFNNLVIQQQITPAKYPIPDFGMPPAATQTSAMPAAILSNSLTPPTTAPADPAQSTPVAEPGLRVPAP